MKQRKNKKEKKTKNFTLTHVWTKKQKPTRCTKKKSHQLSYSIYKVYSVDKQTRRLYIKPESIPVLINQNRVKYSMSDSTFLQRPLILILI